MSENYFPLRIKGISWILNYRILMVYAYIIKSREFYRSPYEVCTYISRHGICRQPGFKENLSLNQHLLLLLLVFSFLKVIVYVILVAALCKMKSLFLEHVVCIWPCRGHECGASLQKSHSGQAVNTPSLAWLTSLSMGCLISSPL